MKRRNLMCASAFAVATVLAAPAAAQVETHRPPAAGASAEQSTAEQGLYPSVAAGWGGYSETFATSRWAEDWSKRRAAGTAPPLKAMPLFGLDDITLTISGEMRLRAEMYDNGGLVHHDNYHNVELRAIVGADLHVGDHFRFYGEFGHATVWGQGDPYTVIYKGTTISAGYQNDIAVQQAFGEARTMIGDKVLVGVMAGRMEFADGPKQLISVSNGNSLHRTFNGFRTYLQTDRFRLSVFRGYVTLLGVGGFDEHVNHGEELTAANGSFSVVPFSKSSSLFVDPMWFHTFNLKDPGATSGIGHRDTYGARVWGRRGPWVFDWMAFRQTGDHLGRDVSAWAATFDTSYQLTPQGWKPRIGLRVDLSSGGDSYAKTGTIHAFSPVYQSSSYLGEGKLLGDSNLMLISPTVSFTPLKPVKVSMEYDLVRRMSENDAFYASGLKPYAGTQNAKGYSVGTYGRVNVDWSVTRNIGLELEGETLQAGHVLHSAGYGSAKYLLLGVDIKY
jgi:hypothetical protein